MPMKNLLPCPSTPSREYVKAMNATVWENKAAGNEEDVVYRKRN